MCVCVCVCNEGISLYYEINSNNKTFHSFKCEPLNLKEMLLLSSLNVSCIWLVVFVWRYIYSLNILAFGFIFMFHYPLIKNIYLYIIAL